MNRCYRLVFNRCTGVWQVAAENISACGRSGYKLLAAAALATTMPIAQAAVEPVDITRPGLYDLLNSSYTANAISADGRVIAGLRNSGALGFIWSSTDGRTDLSPIYSGPSPYINTYAVNADGSVAVGQTTINSNTSRAFRWTSAGGMEDLGTLETSATTSSYHHSSAQAVNGNGNIIVGYAYTDNGSTHAFRWVSGEGMSQLFTTIGGNAVGSSFAYGVNKTGDVVVGSYYDGANSGAFRWTAADGVHSLGALDMDTNTSWSSSARAANAAGDVVVGNSSSSTGSQPFRWTQQTGMVGLGIPATFSSAYATAINGRGNVVVGYANIGGMTFQGFRWEEGIGMQTIEEWLRASGVDTASLTETAGLVNGVSEDGNVLVGQLNNGNVFLARGTSGMIDIAAFNTSLARTAASAIIAENQNDMVFHGMHGSPMQMLLGVDKSGFWLAGDFGRQNRDARKSDMGVGEIGYGHRFSEALQMNIAAGYTHSIAGTDNGGQTRVKSLFVLPELMVTLPGSLYATFSGIYSKGTANIDRGYLNAGKRNLGQGSPDTQSIGARVRLDWHEMASIGGMTLTPYLGLSYLQTTFDAYTESGGGFAARWDKRKEKATTTRAGLDVAKAVSDNVKITGRIEGVHRFEKKNAGASGETVGLGGFSFAGQELKRNWLRAGAGLEGKIGSGIASATINTTTEGEAAAYWLAVNYRWQF